MSLGLDQLKQKTRNQRETSSPQETSSPKSQLTRPWKSFERPKDLIELITDRAIIDKKRIHKKKYAAHNAQPLILDREKLLQERIQKRASSLFADMTKETT